MGLWGQYYRRSHIRTTTLVIGSFSPSLCVNGGGPGAAQEINWAMNAGALIIPVECTGGYAKTLYPQLSASQWVNEDLTQPWQKLAHYEGSSEDIATAIVTLVEKGLEQQIKAPQTTILLVDDSITVRELMSITLRKGGYQVIQAKDGQEAWDKLQTGLTCDLILSNIEMPRMDGFQLLEKVKQDPRFQNIPVALLSSRGEDKMRQPPLWQRLGAVHRFTKPYREEDVLKTIAQILDDELNRQFEQILAELERQQAKNQ